MEIDNNRFADFYFRVHDVAQRLVLELKLPQLPSYFEILTAQALLYFAEQHTDIAVLEVGMGGRLDATNIVDPLLSVVTDISLDHMEWLGNSVAAITREKAGILRHGGTLITLPQHPEANQVLGEIAGELGARTVSAARYVPTDGTVGPYQVEVMCQFVTVNSPLTGAHQHRNVALAIASAVELATNNGFPITPAAIESGIRQTCWPGRLEKVEKDGRIWILDVAHNPAGAWALRAGLSDALAKANSKTLVFSCLRDKPLTELAQILFPIFDRVIFAPIHSSRATPTCDLLKAAADTGTPAVAAGSVEEALQLAGYGGQGGFIAVTGSVFLVGEARSLLLGSAGVNP